MKKFFDKIKNKANSLAVSAKTTLAKDINELFNKQQTLKDQALMARGNFGCYRRYHLRCDSQLK